MASLPGSHGGTQTQPGPRAWAPVHQSPRAVGPCHAQVGTPAGTFRGPVCLSRLRSLLRTWDLVSFWPQHAGPERWCLGAAPGGPRARRGRGTAAPIRVHRRPGPLPGSPLLGKGDKAPPHHRPIGRFSKAWRAGAVRGPRTCMVWRERECLKSRTCPCCTRRGLWRGTVAGSGSEENKHWSQ